MQSELGDGIKGSSDHDDDAVWREFDDLLCYFGDDFLVFLDQVITCHTGLARQTRRDNDDIRVGRIGIVICTDYQGIVADYRPGFEHIKGLTLWHLWNDIEHYDVGIVAFCQALYQRATNKSCPNNGYLTAHRRILSLEITFMQWRRFLGSSTCLLL